MALSIDTSISKRLDIVSALEKIKYWCAYQERCQKEVKDKLHEYGLCTDDVNSVISVLIGENYINEERFANIYTGGKFRIKKWGRLKIKHGLRLRQISDYSIKKALASIDGDDYLNTLTRLIDAKWLAVQEKNPYKKIQKIANYLSSKGYEKDIVMDILKTKETN